MFIVLKWFCVIFFSGFLPYLSAKEIDPLFAPSLKKGDMIAIIAPASCPDENVAEVNQTIKQLAAKGYQVLVAPNLHTRYGYLAGTDAERAKAFMDLWRNPRVKAIWCYRGGYGSQRLLDRLDFDAIGKNPKIFIGMSDITALHAALNKEAGLVTFLGPNVNAVYGKSASSYSEKELFNMISCQPVKQHVYQTKKPVLNAVVTIRKGVGRGRLTGGTLSLVTSLIGTPWQLETRGKILILEEIDEEPYRIDRMLCQLKHAGLLKDLSGVVLCSWLRCQGKRPNKTLTLKHVFQEYFGSVDYPVLMGFPSGHIPDQTTLPLNALAELDADKKTLRLLEEPVR